MNATLSQSLQWTGDAGAHFDVHVGSPNNAAITYKVFEAGSATSATLNDILAGIDFSTVVDFRLKVRSKLPDGSLPSAYSAPLDVTIVGFAIPTGLQIV